MDQAKQIRKGEELDWQSLERYLRSALPFDVSGEMHVSQFHGGHANLTYLLKFDHIELVLRRPPFGKIAPGAHDMKREYRVLSQLYKVFPEAPRAYIYSDDESIIGSHFVVMERKKGEVVRTQLIDCFMPFENAEERLTIAMINAQATLHKLDIRKANLEKLGRPEGFLERQLAGWSQRWELSRNEDNKEMDDVFTLLNAAVPSPQAASIIHNDIKLDNCQFQPDNPDKVTAIFDWDMTTLGDPLVDFGTTLSYWYEPYFEQFDMPVFISSTFPSKSFLIEKYAELTGFSMERIDWYQAFSYWKGGIIAAQLYQRYVNGQTSDQRMQKFRTTAKVFATFAKKILQEV
jgi:aminoglycoside phosphotransferase (APT) family kinase protein